MNANQAQTPVVEIDVCGAENIITIVSRLNAAMQDSYTFAGVNQKVTVPMPPGTRISISMTGADNRVLVSKQLTVAACENTGADNHLEDFSDDHKA
jgi:hypothetical protein